jgi:putative hydrolase of the HAD superfamily
MLSRISCVAFDAVGTLIFPDPPVAEVYARVGRTHGSPLSEQQVRVRFREAFCAEFGGKTTTSEPEERAAWRRIVESIFELDDIEPCFEELFAHFGRAESWRCFPDVAETVQQLSKRGYRLAVASNFDRRLHAICDGHAELRGFSARVISSEIGYFKPCSAFFHALLEQVNCQRHEVLMVGDDWQNDISGPLNIGMPAVFLDRAPMEAISAKDGVPVISSLLGLLELLP